MQADCPYCSAELGEFVERELDLREDPPRLGESWTSILFCPRQQCGGMISVDVTVGATLVIRAEEHTEEPR